MLKDPLGSFGIPMRLVARSRAIGQEHGFALIESMVTLGIIATLTMGLALFMARTMKALQQARRPVHAICSQPSCSPSGTTLQCRCGERAWSVVP